MMDMCKKKSHTNTIFVWLQNTREDFLTKCWWGNLLESDHLENWGGNRCERKRTTSGSCPTVGSNMSDVMSLGSTTSKLYRSWGNGLWGGGMDGTDLGSWSTMGFDTDGVKPSRSATSECYGNTALYKKYNVALLTTFGEELLLSSFTRFCCLLREAMRVSAFLTEVSCGNSLAKSCNRSILQTKVCVQFIIKNVCWNC